MHAFKYDRFAYESDDSYISLRFESDNIADGLEQFKKRLREEFPEEFPHENEGEATA